MTLPPKSVAEVVATLGLAHQTLHSWIKAQREGYLGGPGSKPVSAELARTKMRLAIIKKAAATSRGNRNEARVG